MSRDIYDEEPVNHRTWALPDDRPAMRMSWHDLLFMHWPVPPAAMRPLLPSGLSLDTFDDMAWIGVVPFRMSGVSPLGCPDIPGVSAFPELNVRTYVTVDGRPGVWFFSLDAAKRLAVWIARRAFHLPYFHARMTAARRDGWIEYSSRRTDRRSAKAEFVARYRPTSNAQTTSPGTLDHWLTARYCLYAADRRGHLYRGEIDHSPWQLQTAECESVENTMLDPLGLSLPPETPLLHFASSLDVVAWRLSRL